MYERSEGWLEAPILVEKEKHGNMGKPFILRSVAGRPGSTATHLDRHCSAESSLRSEVRCIVKPCILRSVAGREALARLATPTAA
jgi:hypothetical protein